MFKDSSEPILLHDGTQYDPRKAHEYYLRTRKLHPRQKGSAPLPLAKVARRGGPTFTVKTASGKTVKLNAKQLAKQKAYAAHRVTQIKKKLSTLSKELHQRMAEAKKREADAKKPPTAAEKAKAARDAKAYRDKHKQKIATAAKKAASGAGSSSTASKHKNETVASLKAEIATTKTRLKAAVATQRQLNAATKNG
jgi:hypothetical protein